MAHLLLEAGTEQSVETRVVHTGERAIPFDRFLEMAEGHFVELVRGVVEDKPMIQLDHERCTRWVYQLVGLYVEKAGLGEILSSRIMVKIDGFGGRMPDLLYVRQDRLAIVQQKAVVGTPNLIIEIVSPNDRPSHLRELEAEYFSLGVPELVFVDLQKQTIRLLRYQEEGYAETLVTAGPFTFAALPALTLQAEWLLREPRPDVFDTLSSLLTR